MIYVLYESPSNIILPFMAQLCKEYPNSSRGYVGRKNKIADLVAVYGKPPLFNQGWLLECSPKVSKSVVQKLDEIGKNLVVVRVTNKSMLDKVVEKLHGVEFKLIDNYRLKDEEVLTWIEGELNCSAEASQEIFKRCGGRLKSIITAVGTLSLLEDTLTPAIVRKFVSRVSTLNVNDVGDFLIGAQRRSVKLDRVLDVVYEYKYAFPWLMKYLREYVQKYVTVLGYAARGDLTLANYKDFKQISTDNIIKRMSEAQLKRIVGLLGIVSWEYCCFVLCELKQINEKNRINVYKLIQLIKLGG